MTIQTMVTVDRVKFPVVPLGFIEAIERHGWKLILILPCEENFLILFDKEVGGYEVC